MRIAALCATALAGSLLLAGCEIKRDDGTADPAAEPEAAAVPDEAAPPADADATPLAFDPANVPESTATLPPFPLFEHLEGLTNNLRPAQANVNFDRDYFVAGGQAIPVEGRISRAEYNLTRERPIHRSNSGAITNRPWPRWAV